MDFISNVFKKIIPHQNDAKPSNISKTLTVCGDNNEKKELQIQTQKPRRSVLKEFDPFVTDSPCPPKKQQPASSVSIKEEEHFEDAETSLRLNGTPSKSDILGSCNTLNSLNKSATNLLIPGLQAFVNPLKIGRVSPNPVDTSDIEYVEAFESLSSQPEEPSQEPKSLSSDEDVIIRIPLQEPVVQEHVENDDKIMEKSPKTCEDISYENTASQEETVSDGSLIDPVLNPSLNTTLDLSSRDKAKLIDQFNSIVSLNIQSENASTENLNNQFTEDETMDSILLRKSFNIEPLEEIESSCTVKKDKVTVLLKENTPLDSKMSSSMTHITTIKQDNVTDVVEENNIESSCPDNSGKKDNIYIAAENTFTEPKIINNDKVENNDVIIDVAEENGLNLKTSSECTLIKKDLIKGSEEINLVQPITKTSTENDTIELTESIDVPVNANIESVSLRKSQSFNIEPENKKENKTTCRFEEDNAIDVAEEINLDHPIPKSITENVTNQLTENTDVPVTINIENVPFNIEPSKKIETTCTVDNAIVVAEKNTTLDQSISKTSTRNVTNQLTIESVSFNIKPLKEIKTDQSLSETFTDNLTNQLTENIDVPVAKNIERMSVNNDPLKEIETACTVEKDNIIFLSEKNTNLNSELSNTLNDPPLTKFEKDYVIDVAEENNLDLNISCKEVLKKSLILDKNTFTDPKVSSNDTIDNVNIVEGVEENNILDLKTSSNDTIENVYNSLNEPETNKIDVINLPEENNTFSLNVSNKSDDISPSKIINKPTTDVLQEQTESTVGEQSISKIENTKYQNTGISPSIPKCIQKGGNTNLKNNLSQIKDKEMQEYDQLEIHVERMEFRNLMSTFTNENGYVSEPIQNVEKEELELNNSNAINNSSLNENVEKRDQSYSNTQQIPQTDNSEIKITAENQQHETFYVESDEVLTSLASSFSKTIELEESAIIEISDHSKSDVSNDSRGTLNQTVNKTIELSSSDHENQLENTQTESKNENMGYFKEKDFQKVLSKTIEIPDEIKISNSTQFINSNAVKISHLEEVDHENQILQTGDKNENMEYLKAKDSQKVLTKSIEIPDEIEISNTAQFNNSNAVEISNLKEVENKTLNLNVTNTRKSDVENNASLNGTQILESSSENSYIVSKPSLDKIHTRKSLNTTHNMESPYVLNRTDQGDKSINNDSDNVLNKTRDLEENINTLNVTPDIDISKVCPRNSLNRTHDIESPNFDSGNVCNESHDMENNRKSLNFTQNIESPIICSTRKLTQNHSTTDNIQKSFNQTQNVKNSEINSPNIETSKTLLNTTHNVKETCSRSSPNLTTNIESPTIKTNNVKQENDVMVDSLEDPVLERRDSKDVVQEKFENQVNEKSMVDSLETPILGRTHSNINEFESGTPEAMLKPKSPYKTSCNISLAGPKNANQTGVVQSLNDGVEEKSSKELKLAINSEILREAKKRHYENLKYAEMYRRDVPKYQALLGEYERQITRQNREMEILREENQTIARHFSNLELAFSDVFQKYERTKSVVQAYKENEDRLSKTVSAMEEAAKESERRYVKVKKWIDDQVEQMNMKVIETKEKYTTEVNSLRMKVKRYEIRCASMETSLKQKTEECQQLAALCDDIGGQ